MTRRPPNSLGSRAESYTGNFSTLSMPEPAYSAPHGDFDDTTRHFLSQMPRRVIVFGLPASFHDATRYSQTKVPRRVKNFCRDKSRKGCRGLGRSGGYSPYRKYGSAEGLFAHDEGEGAAAHDVAVRQERSAKAPAIRTPLTAPAIRAAKATILLTVISAAIL